MKVFVGGSRRISRLDASMQERLDKVVAKGLHVLVGDANGADKAVQRYLKERGYDKVEVFCVSDFCRNNLGNWPLRPVRPSSVNRDYDYFAEKDRAMANEADYGLMIWDGKSLGTALNVLRLARQQKPVVVYRGGQKQSTEIRTEADVARLLARSGADVLRRAMKRIEYEEAGQQAARERALFGQPG